MKDFFWQYFSVTGNVDAYVLYKEENGDWPEEMEFRHEEPPAQETGLNY